MFQSNMVTVIFRVEDNSTLKIEAPTSSAILVIFHTLHGITLQKTVISLGLV
jgi:phosphotransferase system IIA component